MKKYEIMYIVDPTVLEEPRKELVEKVNEILKAAGAQSLKTESWGERKLAYAINKKKSGYYFLSTFEIDGTALTEVEAKLNILENIIRYILVKQD